MISKLIPFLSSLLLLIIISTCSSLSTTSQTSKSINELDICGENGHIDSHALNIGSTPWNVARDSSYIDISPCSTFINSSNYRNYYIPDECKQSHICHNITDKNGHIRSIGYQLKHVISEFGTTRAIYIGSSCADNINYTINLRFTCGNHLGHPSFPLVSIKTKCAIILNWETSAACRQQIPTSSFGLNEMKCYVLDNQNRIRDLTPLIRTNGSYQVMADSKEFYINVCSAIGGMENRCSTLEGSSACQLTTGSKRGFIESVGTYKWSDMKFIPSNEQNEREHIELTYYRKATASEFNPVTKIRFICPRQLSKSVSYRNYPILVSDLDSEYIIEWITDYACPMDMIEQLIDPNTCQFEQINLKTLPKTEFVIENIPIQDRNKTIIMNICGSVSRKCSTTSSVCLVDGHGFRSIGSKSEGKFFKADNRLNIVFSSKKVACKNNQGNSMNSRTIIELECDRFADKSTEPKFIRFASDTCEYKFNWKTSIVCPLFEQTNLNCSLITKDSNDNLIQVDLSSLRLSDSVHRTQSTNIQFLFNVCDRIPSMVKNMKIPKNCQHSAACMIDKANNLSFNIGNFNRPITYNKQSKTFELLYTDGFDLTRNKTVNTRIIFICSTYQVQPVEIDFDGEHSEYVLEFRTPAACPMNPVIGDDCKIYDSFTGHSFDLSPLKSASYYVIRGDQYEFELNLCGPIVDGSCERPDTAICQKELLGQKRKFSLGTSHDKLVYWNSILNMTFTNGDPYNDVNHTPRKSHISFVCDETAGKGHPEFIGESNRSYSFIWYTSLACVEEVPKTSHCTFENETHFIDFSPLSLSMGNHFVLSDDQTLIKINFCKSLNRERSNLVKLCKPNSAACMIQMHSPGETIITNLGEPSEPPMTGFDGDIYFFLNNGDPCPYDSKINLTSSFRMECDRESGQMIKIMQVDPDERRKCTYEFIVQSPIACAQKLTETKFEDCVYTDPRTNLSADFNPLMKTFDYEINPKNPLNRTSSKFIFNICKKVRSVDCGPNEAICFSNVDKTLVSYGSMNQLRVYMKQNLHLRYSGGAPCDKTLLSRRRSTDIEMVCSTKQSNPIVVHYDECLVKMYWETPSVCSLKIPSCSLFDSDGNYYSLRQLSSLTHSWRVKMNNTDNYYLINVCKSLPSATFQQFSKDIANTCGKQSAVCQCSEKDGCTKGFGKVSDHELTLDPDTKHLLLTYEEEILNCIGPKGTLLPSKTEIQFQCSTDTGINGPKFINQTDCTLYFIWNTSFACPHNLVKNDEYRLSLTNDMILIDTTSKLRWDLSELFKKKIIARETRTRDGLVEHYDYHIHLDPNNDPIMADKQCSQAAVCQTNGNGLNRDIGTLNEWQFVSDGNIALNLNIHSKTSTCGRNKLKKASTKIFFECIDSHQQNNKDNESNDVSFLYESDDCEYYFLWRTPLVCPLLEEQQKSSRSNHDNDSNGNGPKQRSFMLPIILLLIVICCLLFVSHRYYHEINVRNFICRHMERLRNHRGSSPTTSDVNFRYQPLEL
uniref:Cation-independent mannose-6-phosphate receptor-like isoform X2 n=1 Tax=Dermatophagoides pteronyssinus TaxID=6956 RepID=A0A6P6Y1U1_DERPT|nr:cation-independent mannose-6-phosphate receptor-like isoform X2 [Dermatophagoides pteronyssinus]